MKDKYPGLLAQKLNIQVDNTQASGTTTATLGEHIDQLWQKFSKPRTCSRTNKR